MKAYLELEQRYDDLSNLEHMSAILNWDEAVMMPAGGGSSRAKAMAYLQRLKHQQMTDERIYDLLQLALTEELEHPWQRRNLNLIQKEYEKLSVVPAQLIGELAEATVLTEQAWRQYRAENNWQDFFPMLEHTFRLVKEVTGLKAQKLGVDDYDVLLDEYSPECNQALISPLFAQLKQELPALADVIIEKQSWVELKPLTGNYPISRQKAMAECLMKTLGFDFKHGRLDVSHHPFCGGVPDDIRVTTRFDPNEFVSAMMGVCHETGHALYELGLPRDKQGQPVGQAYGMALHESQSLLIEMQVCRSRAFMPVMTRALSEHFEPQTSLNPDNLYRHYTRVQRDYIRVDADEVTYPLHVVLRYEIEQELFKGTIEIKDLPEVWDEKMQAYFGLSTAGNYADGVMQDVHWPCGAFGYFPAYTLGALLAAQLYQAASVVGAVNAESIARGDLSGLIAWLGEHIHRHASEKNFDQLVSDASGARLSATPFLNHIKSRYLNGDV